MYIYIFMLKGSKAEIALRKSSRMHCLELLVNFLNFLFQVQISNLQHSHMYKMLLHPQSLTYELVIPSIWHWKEFLIFSHSKIYCYSTLTFNIKRSVKPSVSLHLQNMSCTPSNTLHSPLKEGRSTLGWLFVPMSRLVHIHFSQH